MNNKTKRLTESAMLLALAIVLELISKMLIPEYPFGGQITLVAMLPVLLISYRHGVKWGLVSAFAYSLLEMVLGAKTVSAAFLPGYFGDGAMIGSAILMCMMDYVLAFTVLGVAGMFRNKIKNSGAALALGGLVAMAGRLLCHFISGYILFAGYAEWFFTQEAFPFHGFANWVLTNLSGAGLGAFYSFVYNALYMVPEMVFTTVAAFLIARIPGVVKKVS